MDDDPQEIPGAPNIIGVKAKAVDLTYRQMEESSIARAEMAGDPSLKMTNMKDNLQIGEVSGTVPNNIVSQTSEMLGYGFKKTALTTALAQAKSGPPGTGQRALEAIQGGKLPKANEVPTVAGMKAKWGG